MKPTPAVNVRPTALTIALALFLALALSGLSPRTLHRATLVKSASLSNRAVVDAYGKLPLSFEANHGQTDSHVKFLSRGQGYALFLTPTEAVLSLRKGGNESRPTSFTSLSSDFRLAASPAQKMESRRSEPARSQFCDSS